MTADTLPIYLLPGMTADFPLYNRLLPLLPNAKVVEFIAPIPGEALSDYAARMAPLFVAPCFIGGVSFGSILALEISRLVQPAGCILISGIQKPSELPPWLRAWRLIGGRYSAHVLKLVGDSARMVPRAFRTAATLRLTKLGGTEGSWHRWATSAVLDWTPRQPVLFPLLQIHGTADTTFPVRYTHPDVVIAGGGHTLPASHPVETAHAILNFTGAAQHLSPIRKSSV